MDPLSKVIETIMPPILLAGSGVEASFEVPPELYIQLGKKHHSVEIRCLRLDGTRNMHETTWPDIGDISVNGMKMKEFQPLMANSSLKKRKDERIIVKDVSIIVKGENRLSFREGNSSHLPHKSTSYRMNPTARHVIAVFLVRKITHAEVIANATTLSVDDSKAAIRELFASAETKVAEEVVADPAGGK